MAHAPKTVRARQIKSLAWARSGGAGGTGDTAQVTCPEQCKVQSASHEGNVFRHQRTWVPPSCRVPPAPRKREPIPGEQELLYLALYRDKVAEVARHQEELSGAGAGAGTARGGRAAAARRQRESSEGPGGTLHRLDGGGEFHSGPADLSGSGPPPEGLAAAERRPGGLADRDGCFKPSGGPEAMLREGPAPGVPPDDRLAAAAGSVTGAGLASTSAADHGRSLRGVPAASHVASVPVHAAFGGVVSEHLESKQLGALFEQWRAKQEEETNTMFSTTRTRAARRGRGGAAGIPTSVSSRAASDRGSALATRSITEDSETPEQRSRDQRSDAADAADAAFSPEPVAEEGGSASSVGGSGTGARAGVTVERSKADRMYSLLTNPKTRLENFAERGSNDHDAAQPSHIEGIPVLNLTKLYEGPWRLS